MTDNTIPHIVKLSAVTLSQEFNTFCDSCFLPSGYDCTYAVECDGLALEVLRIQGCAECGPRADQAS